VKCLRPNNGEEYVRNDFESYFSHPGIAYQRSIFYTPQQNGIAERKN
jgi:hypothetical protein